MRIFDAAPRVGGAIRTIQTDGWLIEEGPNTALTGEPALTALIAELGLTSEVVTANPAAKNRYIVRGGWPIAAPLSPPAFLKSPLFSFGARLKILAEARFRPRTRNGDLSLEDFVRSHFGQQAVDYGLNPFVTGVYAGDPKRLSARHAFPKLWEAEQKHGSLLRGQIAEARARRERGEKRPEIISFRQGLQTLPDAIAALLPANALTLNARIESLVPTGGRWNVSWNAAATAQTEAFDTVIAALPAPGLAQLRIGVQGDRPLAPLDAIEHPPVSSLFLGYRREQVAHPLDGFGMLIPAVEKRGTLGILFSSTLFPDRAPEDNVALTVLVGGTRQPEIARLPTEKILAAIAPDLRELLGVLGEPVFQHHTFWPRAIPQYNLGRERHLDLMAATEAAQPGLLIGGQARDGIALPACLAAGEKLAARALVS